MLCALSLTSEWMIRYMNWFLKWIMLVIIRPSNLLGMPSDEQMLCSWLISKRVLTMGENRGMRATWSHYFSPNIVAFYCPFSSQRVSETWPNMQLCFQRTGRDKFCLSWCRQTEFHPPWNHPNLILGCNTSNKKTYSIVFTSKRSFIVLNPKPQFHGNLWDQKMLTTK